MFVKKLVNQVICDPDNPVVQTPKGKLRGLIVDGTYIFRGIQYATARRFHMPEPIPAWERTKDAIIYGTVCPEIQTVMPNDNYTVPHVFYPQDENCQYLNVWTQHINEDAKRPVMVWLHGGGFSTGSGIEHFAYDGENMSRYADAVIVTLNHRLNVLGYLDLSKYADEYKYSGNVGMADIVEALRWVRDNIASFGGDPDNVTIFGQSGGGGKVAALLQIPAADGLFHRAIIQSGIMPASIEGTRPKVTAEAIMEKLSITPDRVKELETIPYFRLSQAVMSMGSRAGMAFGPHADGEYYLGSIFDVGVRQHAKTIPVMVGNVLGEFQNNFNATADDGKKNTWSEEKRIEVIRSILGKGADAAIEAFRKAYPEKNIADLLFTDPKFRIGALDYARTRAEAGCTNTYNFVFSLEHPLYGGTTPWHNAEIPYVFHNADYIEPSYIPGVTEHLQDIMCSAWTNFAANGVPSATFMPQWPAYTNDCHATMIFDTYVKCVIGHDEALMAALPSAGCPTTPVNRTGIAKHFGGGPRV